jgi:ribosomal protein S18 acetylase RimI-like enzyme
MNIRTMADPDLPTLISMTIETFRPFYEGYVHDLMGDEVFAHQHGDWEQDYRDEVPTLHAPEAGRHVAVCDLDGGIIGYVSWKIGPKARHGEIYVLAVAPEWRGHHVGRQLCDHAIAEMKQAGVDVVGIGTGDDDFHAAARGLYESLGFTKVPIAGYLKRI